MVEQDNEYNISLVIDAIKEDTGVEHESGNGKNTEKTETRGADEQPSTLSPGLEEQHEEPQSSLYIDAAIEVPKTLYTIDNSLESDLILATKELPKHLDTTYEREIEVDVTSSNEVDERKFMEEKINEEERTEELESKYVDKQQSHSPKAMEEQVEN